MRRVNRSAILSGVSLRASKQEERIINAIDNHTKSQRREQAPAISEPNYHTTLTWGTKSRQVTRSWTF